MIKQTKGHKTRKPYRKPQIEQVRLVPEEAVLGWCKTGSGGGTVLGTSDCSLEGCVLNGT